MTGIIICISMIIMVVTIVVIVAVNAFSVDQFSLLSYKHFPSRPAPIPNWVKNQSSPFEGGGLGSGCGAGGFGAGRGGSCNGITVPVCGDSFSLLISDGFENIVDITVGLDGSVRINAPTVMMKKPVDGSLHTGNRTMKTVELRFGSLGSEFTGVKVGIEPLQRGNVIRIEGNNLGDGGEVRFTRHNGRHTTGNNRQRSRYDGGNQSHRRTKRVTGRTRD